MLDKKIICVIILSIILLNNTECFFNIENLWCESDDVLCGDNNCKVPIKESYKDKKKIGEPINPYFEMNKGILRNSCNACGKIKKVDNREYAYHPLI